MSPKENQACVQGHKRSSDRIGEVRWANEDPLKSYCMVPIPRVSTTQVLGILPSAKTCMWNPEYDQPCDRETCSNMSQLSSPGTRVQHSRRFTNTLPTWRVRAFNLLFGPVCNFCGRWTRIARTNERLAGGVWTGKFNSYFPPGRGINQRLSVPCRNQIRAWSHPAVLRPGHKKASWRKELRGTVIHKPAEL